MPYYYDLRIVRWLAGRTRRKKLEQHQHLTITRPRYRVSFSQSFHPPKIVPRHFNLKPVVVISLDSSSHRKASREPDLQMVWYCVEEALCSLCL
ncbi:hypothetical protein RRG08_016445 [Elysia crispata]|uniref:Uncharacterized protein n=1 Tax=Elysia crispata TaxID=231223 RepID=A0AAE0Y955_9GAST|nr:hypothetical protein RRG08_016445 [Elysia crispata]